MAEATVIEAKRKTSGLLLDTLTLLHAAYDAHEGIPVLNDPSDFTSASSRIGALLIMAQDKTIEALKTLDA